MPALGMVSPTRAPPKGTGVLGREEQQGRKAVWERVAEQTCGSPWAAPSPPLSGPQFPCCSARFCTVFNRFLQLCPFSNLPLVGMASCFEIGVRFSVRTGLSWQNSRFLLRKVQKGVELEHSFSLLLSSPLKTIHHRLERERRVRKNTENQRLQFTTETCHFSPIRLARISDLVMGQS